MRPSFVVTGGAGGVGRAIAERLTERGYVVILDRDADRLAWTRGRANVEAVIGGGTDEAILNTAVDRAAAAGTLMGWVNNASFKTPLCTPHPSPRSLRSSW